MWSKPSRSDNNRALPAWAMYVGVIGGVALIIGISYGLGNRYYYQVYPPGQAVVPTLETPPSVIVPERVKYYLPFDQAFASAKVSTEGWCDVDSFNPDYPRVHSDTFLTAAVLVDIQKKLCSVLMQNGQSAIQKTLVVVPGDYDDDRGGHSGLGFMGVDGKQLLVEFALHLMDDYTYQFSIRNMRVLNDFSTISSVSITPFPLDNKAESKLLTIKGSGSVGKAITQYRTQNHCKHCDATLFDVLLVSNADGSFSTIVELAAGGGYVGASQSPNVRFLLPYTASSDYNQWPARDYGLEQGSISPIYHKASCGLEDVYGDVAEGGFYAGDHVAIDVNLGFEPRLHLTTPQTGYVAEQWGKILEDINMSDFIKKVQTPKAFNSNAQVEMLTISGYQVKHIGSITLDRTCQNLSGYTRTADMYQAVKNGAVITFTVSHEAQNQKWGSSDVAIEKVIGQVLSTITLTRP